MKWLWIGIFAAVLIWSGVHPKDQLTWFLEVFPALAGGIILLLTRLSFPLTPLVYMLILVHCIILIVGGHYTYAEVPLFDWIRDTVGGQRNNYDKLGHFAQGVVPAMIARELLIRKKVINGSSWRYFLSSVFAWPFPPSMNCLNGGVLLPLRAVLKIFSQPRGISGTPSLICCWLWLALSLPWFSWGDCTTGNLPDWQSIKDDGFVKSEMAARAQPG